VCDCTALPPASLAPTLISTTGLPARRRLGRRGAELVAIANAFDVTGDDADARVAGEEIAEVAELEIALVPGAEEVADADFLGVARAP
jgi:hypothetical protein